MRANESISLKHGNYRPPVAVCSSAFRRSGASGRLKAELQTRCPHSERPGGQSGISFPDVRRDLTGAHPQGTLRRILPMMLKTWLQIFTAAACAFLVLISSAPAQESPD